MATTVKLAEYLFTRLHQLGIRATHGVPGDYNLTLLDYIEPAGIHWVGNCNELNAGYAADGYARIKGIGALITTFGVGELSTINAIAGAYCERAPVVHIVGTPDRDAQDSRATVHHTFNDGNFGRFAQMHAHITVAQANLRNLHSAPSQIDAVLKECIVHSRPVYIQVPVDLVDAPVPSGSLWTDCLSLKSMSRGPEVPSSMLDSALSMVLEKIQSAKQPVILVDGETRALGITEDVQSIVEFTNWPTWVTTFGKGLVDETAPNVYGVYRGSYDPRAKAFVDSSDLVLCFGPHYSSTNTFDYTSIPPKTVTISFTDTEVRSGERVFRDVPARIAVSQLRQQLSALKFKTGGTYDIDMACGNDTTLSAFSSVHSKDAIKQDRLWRFLANLIRPGDIVMGETGTAGYGVQEFRLPRYSRVFAPTTWLSIGYMLPAAQGAALAQRDLIGSSDYHGLDQARTMVFIGDGSLQMTIQELGTIIRERLDVTIFLINNDGYTIERCIHGLNKTYNDIGRWRYPQAPHFFGADQDVFTATALTWEDLQNVLEAMEDRTDGGLRMIEIVLDRQDVPVGPLLDLLVEERKAVERES
ncbi:hypothetical protein LTS17_011618 [Exophiala oligosperma]